MNLSKPIPILRSFDETKAKEFYVDFLELGSIGNTGLQADLPLYMQISKGDCIMTETLGREDSSERPTPTNDALPY